MVILGINGGFRQGYQDVSACLVINGRVVAAIEEERLSRVKFAPGRLPYLSVREVLSYAGLSIENVDIVAFHGATWGDDFDSKLTAYFNAYFGHCPSIKRYHHHDCHTAGTYFSSGFQEALVFSMDNSGDGVSIQVSLGKGNSLTTLKRFDRPTSFGLYYSLITQYCGFLKDSDEYKLMGLAAYGNPHAYDFSWLLNSNEGNITINTDYIQIVPPMAPSLHRDEMNFNPAFVSKMAFGRRLPHSPMTQFYKDVAASAQHHMENLMVDFVQHYINKTGIKKVCLSGGVALNCLMNQKLMNAPEIEELFIQPASSDAGISVGAAWLATLETNGQPIAPENAFLGNCFDNESILAVLENCQVAYTYLDDVAEMAAALLVEGKVIGWFQGRMEFGPRALGNRSILANPLCNDIQSLVNKKVKFRDAFRPFGASVLEEDVHTYFLGAANRSPYMTVTYDVKNEYQEKLKGVTHVDGTCRIQSVSKVQSPLFHQILYLLKQKTGYGVCLNTSFNLNDEPIVATPQQALSSFFGCGLDALFMGNYLIKK